MSTLLRKKRFNYIIVGILAFLLIVSLISAVSVFSIYRGNLKEKVVEEKYDKYFVLITDNNKSSFWRSVYKGAAEEARKQNVYVEAFGDNLSKEYSKEELMEIAINSDVNGIIIEADEGERMTELINEASEKNIAVVTVGSDNTKSKRQSFIGIGSYNLGREYGNQVLQIAADKEKLNVAVIISSDKSNSGQNILYLAIQEVVEKGKQENMDIQITPVSVDSANIFAAEESIRNLFMHSTQPDIVICQDELNTACVYQAVVDYNLVGKVNILGYYVSEAILNAIDRNVINATISIDTEQMGQYCVRALQEYLDYGNTNQYYMADISLVNKDNVGDFLDK